MNNIFKINFHQYSKIFLLLSGLIFIISILLILFKGIQTSIDFRGGTIINVNINTEEHNLTLLREKLSEQFNQSVGVVEMESSIASQDIILTMEYLSNEKELDLIFNDMYGTSYKINKIESIGPKIGDELRKNARNAIIIALLLIGLYITIRFDISYAAGSLFALLHDIIITLGIFIIMNFEISIAIIAALLTIVGYSLNDTIVIYDRIRENTLKNPHRERKIVVDESLNQTLSRTIVTSFTTLMVVIVLYIYGGEVLQPFAFALIIGVILGTYSSLFIASPIMLFLDKKFNIEIEEQEKQ